MKELRLKFYFTNAGESAHGCKAWPYVCLVRVNVDYFYLLCVSLCLVLYMYPQTVRGRKMFYYIIFNVCFENWLDLDGIGMRLNIFFRIYYWLSKKHTNISVERLDGKIPFGYFTYAKDFPCHTRLNLHVSSLWFYTNYGSNPNSF